MAIYSRYPLKVLQEVEPFPPIQNTANPYATEAAMHADQANQLEGYGYLVDGVGAFTYLGTVEGTAADYEGFVGERSGERTRKEVSNTTQYTLIGADYTDFYLDFTADLGQTIDLNINTGIIPANGQAQIISSGNNFIVPTAGAGITFITPPQTNLKTVGKGSWLGIIETATADSLSINGSLESTAAGGGEMNVQPDWNITDNTLDSFIQNKPTIPAAEIVFTNTVDGLVPAPNASGTTTYSGVITSPAQGFIITEGVLFTVTASEASSVGTETRQKLVNESPFWVDDAYHKVVNIDTQNLTTYDLLENSKIPTLYIFNNSGSSGGVLVTIKEGTTCPHIFISGRGFSDSTLSIDFGTNITGFLPDNSTNKVNVNGTIELLLKDSFVFEGTAISDYIYKGDFIKLFEIFESPNGTLYQVGVDDTGARTSTTI